MARRPTKKAAKKTAKKAASPAPMPAGGVPEATMDDNVIAKLQEVEGVNFAQHVGTFPLADGKVDPDLLKEFLDSLPAGVDYSKIKFVARNAPFKRETPV